MRKIFNSLILLIGFNAITSGQTPDSLLVYIHIESVSKDKVHSNIYHVKGRSRIGQSGWSFSGKVMIDSMQGRHSGAYSNNQFEGTWTSRDGRRTVTANWGDFRIPNSGDLDIGAVKFSPSEKYYPFGWSKE